MTDAQRMLAQIVRYADHLSGCASNVEQTAEFCTCGYRDAERTYRELYRQLGKSE